ncbi:hypothetical protein [Ferrigenium kumadai]|uniref:hypothetical protein n=1 Tax=Ferrigenium kumadai TaxID=1682490 RepID=UPI001BB36BE0|nr:hypothetical protein [Ferrigenium kumadai]
MLKQRQQDFLFGHGDDFSLFPLFRGKKYDGVPNLQLRPVIDIKRAGIALRRIQRVNRDAVHPICFFDNQRRCDFQGGQIRRHAGFDGFEPGWMTGKTDAFVGRGIDLCRHVFRMLRRNGGCAGRGAKNDEQERQRTQHLIDLAFNGLGMPQRTTLIDTTR